MPDWFYRTVSRPLLFRMEAERARGFACGFMARVGRLPGGVGTAFIDFLGHMRPDPRLSTTCLELPLSGPVGLGCRLDGRGAAAVSWSRFGFSFIEFGPVDSTAESARGLAIRGEAETLRYEGMATVTPGSLAAKIGDLAREDVRVLVRLRAKGGGSPEDSAKAVAELGMDLAEVADWFSLDFGDGNGFPSWDSEGWRGFWGVLGTSGIDQPWFLIVDAEEVVFIEPEILGLPDGLLVEAIARKDGGNEAGPANLPALKAAVSGLRTRLGEVVPILASGGIHQPVDAAEVLGAGATLIALDTGLIFSGPGLPKRVNEAILSTLPERGEPAHEPPVRQSWFWAAAMGLGMLLGSVIALWIAFTRVVLPYDEAFCGITRSELARINERILPFMSHDRVTLAGTMIAIGMIYLGYSWFGSRRGEHWTKVAVLASAAVGFLSFFLFLGFDYFDPFHGFVTVVLFQFYIQAMVGGTAPSITKPLPEWRETREWRRGQWGQLLLILHGCGLLGAGLVISAIGVGDVFVRADLEYLRTDLATLKALNPNLVPLVAHDRATLGGMLVSSGIVYLLGALWGLRRGSVWLWTLFLWSGSAAYACAIGIHLHVGYLDLEHLLPAFAGFCLLVSGLALCRGWVFLPPPPSGRERVPG